MANIRKLHPKMAEKAQAELNEVPERIEKDLAHLKDWIEKQPHLNVWMDDQWLLVFLRGSKYSLERAKQKIDTFYTSRKLIPDFFRNRDPTIGLLKETFHMCTIHGFEDKEDPTKPFFTYYRQELEPSAVNQATIAELLKLAFLLTEIWLRELDSFSVNGQSVVIDFELLTFSHLIHFTPSLIKKVLLGAEKIYPIRIKAVHFINSPPAWERTLKLVKSICSAKLSSRIFIHETLDTLWEHFPKKLMTSHLGGDGPSLSEIQMETEKWVNKHRDYLLEDEKRGSDENLRLGKPETIESFLGIEGSFRQLSVD